jgi:hypothetical protein
VKFLIYLLGFPLPQTAAAFRERRFVRIYNEGDEGLVDICRGGSVGRRVRSPVTRSGSEAFVMQDL